MFLTVSEIRFTPYDCFLRHAHGVRLYISQTQQHGPQDTHTGSSSYPSIYVSIDHDPTDNSAHTYVYAYT